jgi:3-deoxy-7-phosphoheptulonate synthase
VLIVLHARATQEDVDGVCAAISALGLQPAPLPGGTRTAIGVLGNDKPLDPGRFSSLPGVREVIRVSVPYKRVSREWQPHDTVVDLGDGVRIGGPEPVLIAGPCSVETDAQLETMAALCVELGIRVLRAGAYKPRTSPYDFQGLGLPGLHMLADARRRHGLKIITEAIDIESAEAVAEYADVIQIGARNMQNFALIRHIGKLGKPVLLKRGASATINEWLLAAEYLLDVGNSQVMLCERGLRGFDSATRNLLDLSAVPVVRQRSHLPVLVDPSHGTGRRELILPMARAAMAAGAQGLLVESHPDPAQAWSDGAQSLNPEQLRRLVRETGVIARAMAELSPALQMTRG